jgi:hypothetical protein
MNSSFSVQLAPELPVRFQPTLAAKRMSGVAASMPEGGLAAFHPKPTVGAFLKNYEPKLEL